MNRRRFLRILPLGLVTIAAPALAFRAETQEELVAWLLSNATYRTEFFDFGYQIGTMIKLPNGAGHACRTELGYGPYRERRIQMHKKHAKESLEYWVRARVKQGRLTRTGLRVRSLDEGSIPSGCTNEEKKKK